MPEAENQMTDTGVISMISVRAMSELTAKCSAANELGTEEVSRKIQACEFSFSHCKISSTQTYTSACSQFSDVGQWSQVFFI